MNEGTIGNSDQFTATPIGLHPARILAIDGLRIHVDHLEALDGTPILDIKPALGPVETR